MPSPLPAARARHLRRGVNLSHWFAQVYSPIGYTPEHFDACIRPADFALIRGMGFDHVRFTINCEPIIAAASPDGRLPADYLARIETAARALLDHGLAVILDIHPEDAFKKQLATHPAAVAGFVGFWHKFAGTLAHLDPERTFFEVLNEPCIHDAARWSEIQAAATAAIRRAAPEHTIIISGDQWSQLPELLKLTPPDDPNLIANFHLYDPTAFTHQGAGWSPSWAMFTKGLTYPADPAFTAEFLKTVADPEARRQLDEYARESWSAPVYDEFIRPAVAWARARGLCLTCNEFGVYKNFAPRASRLAWTRDVSAALARNGVGWTVWDYAGSFAVVVNRDGVRSPDRELAAALGLRPPLIGK